MDAVHVFELVIAMLFAVIALHYESLIDDHVLHELERDLDLEEMAAQSAKAT